MTRFVPPASQVVFPKLRKLHQVLEQPTLEVAMLVDRDREADIAAGPAADVVAAR
jgi:hypothetical protein